MTKYMLLYIGGGMPETEAMTAKVLKDWETWYTTLGSAVVDPGYPFTPAAKSISSNGSIKIGTNGVKATGYTIIQAKSLDDAVNLAKTCPVLESGAEVSVFETMEVM